MTASTAAGPLVAALLFSASPAFAQGGVDLSWNDCGSFGRLQRNFACDSNVGQEILIGSAVSGLDLPQLNGMYAVIDLQTNQAALSNWWQLGAGGCRQGTLSAEFSFAPALASCFDPWSGTASGGTTYDAGTFGPNRARVRVFCTPAVPVAINGTDEYEFFELTIAHAQSIGSGSCGGCTNAACIELRLIQLSDAGRGTLSLTNPWNRHIVQFQSAVFNCPPVDEEPLAARRATWGAVKSLYRR